MTIEQALSGVPIIGGGDNMTIEQALSGVPIVGGGTSSPVTSYSGGYNNGYGRNATPAEIEGIAAAIWMDGGCVSGWGDGSTRRQRFISKFNEATADAIQDYINAHAWSG